MPLPVEVAPGLPESSVGIEAVRAYHERTQHHFAHYAPGPGSLDWENQPKPFRRYPGCATHSLPWLHDGYRARESWLGRSFESLREPIAPAPADEVSLGLWLALSLGITAWKELLGDRWAVRANPSSGNLHPVEAYLVVDSGFGLAAGVYHYCPDEHLLEQRALFAPRGEEEKLARVPRAFLALTTVPWRETWKYGERAFRYCQLDVGHARAALDFSARALGWSLCERSVEPRAIRALLGLDRSEDFPTQGRSETEHEESELLLEIVIPSGESQENLSEVPADREARFFGTANRIDPHPLYSWPAVMDILRETRGSCVQVDRAERSERGTDGGRAPSEPSLRSFAELVLSRRSAQRFRPDFVLPEADFHRILEETVRATLETPKPCLGGALAYVLWVHSVEGFAPGVYLLEPRSESDRENSRPPRLSLQQSLTRNFELRDLSLAGAPGLFLVREVELRTLRSEARRLHCNQDIAGSCAFALGMFTDLSTFAAASPYEYRRQFRKAGVIGQHLYLVAESLGVQGTGIGCFFDSGVREALHLEGTSFASLYHFTIGKSLPDSRIATGLPYPAFGPSPPFRVTS